MKNLKFKKNILMVLLAGFAFSNIYAEEEEERSRETHGRREKKEDHRKEGNERREGYAKKEHSEVKSVKKQLFYRTINEINKKHPIKKFFLTLKKDNRELYNDAMLQFLDVLGTYSEIKENNNENITKLYFKSEFLEIFSKIIALDYLEKIETNKNIPEPKIIKELLGKIFDLKIKLLKLGFEDEIVYDDHDGDDADNDANHDGDDTDNDTDEDLDINENNDKITDDKYQKELNVWIKKRIAVKDEVIRRHMFELLNPEKVELYRW